MTEECNAVGNDIVSALLALCYCCHHILTFTQINGCDTYSAVMGWGGGVCSHDQHDCALKWPSECCQQNLAFFFPLFYCTLLKNEVFLKYL